ncbi:MAG: hypothetical protein WC279_13290 [Sulfurimonas sp.]|jgi:hypothetical protein|uniref:hypothetical protein n=1 Tax=Sulfurimonas sp. TaxID=2022749 RepID=UPI003564F353
MIASTLKDVLTDSGCTYVLYESDKLANLVTDEGTQDDIIGLIIQPNSVNLVVRANAILEQYPPYYIEVMKQVRLEDAADNNEIVLQELLDICKQIIVRLIDLQLFRTIMPLRVDKILENKYDANVIGWSMPLDLTYLLNENREPCK